MTLAELVIGGRKRKVLMQAPKDGFFYVIDRETGKPISAGKIGKVTWAKGIDLATGRPIERSHIYYDETGRATAGLEAQYRYQPPPVTFTSAAHACIVEVDAMTGFVRIRRWVCSEDVGMMINPAVVEGQIAGGLAQAIGMVLLEQVCIDERGSPTTVTYKDYLLPAVSDVPDFEYLHASTPSQAEGGFRGVGEGGCIIGPPTLVNAIADALSPFGELRLELPLTPSKILERIEGRPISRTGSGARRPDSVGASPAPASAPTNTGSATAALSSAAAPEGAARAPPTAGLAIDGT